MDIILYLSDYPSLSFSPVENYRTTPNNNQPITYDESSLVGLRSITAATNPPSSFNGRNARPKERNRRCLDRYAALVIIPRSASSPQEMDGDLHLTSPSANEKRRLQKEIDARHDGMSSTSRERCTQSRTVQHNMR